MHSKQHSPIPGLILVVVGILFILGNLGALRINGEVFWTYIIIFIGAVFWMGFFMDRTRVGHLMPGSVLLTVGLVFNYCARYGWNALEYLWPFFILAPAFGFYMMFLLGKREKGLLIPAAILTVVGIVMLLQSFDRSIRYIWPAALIIIGVLLILRAFSGRDRTSE